MRIAAKSSPTLVPPIAAPQPFRVSPPSFRVSRFAFRVSRAFSLVEVLMATFILGIGLIMVASVFPVGANWTRQTTEDSIAQSIAQNAFTVIQKHYAVTSPYSVYLDPNNVANGSGLPSPILLPPPLTPRRHFIPALPSLTRPAIPVTERAYLFGSPTPFPVPVNSLPSCTYFWTALCRLDPIHSNGGAIVRSSSYKYDLYILVFRKRAGESNIQLCVQCPAAESSALDGLHPRWSLPNLFLRCICSHPCFTNAG